jgi:uncharacterized lipoprotein YajG
MKQLRNRSPRSIPLSSLPVLIFLLLGSCALTQEHINVEYIPQAGVTKISQAERAVVRVEVDDQRSSKSHVGHKVNGYGMEMAEIIADNDIPQMVKSAVETELTDRGFTLGSDGSVINILLGKFENRFELGFFSGTATSDVSMLITVKRPDGAVVYTKSIHTEGVNSGVQIAGGENAKIALEAGLKEAITKLFDDNAFLNSFFSGANSRAQS